MKNKNLKKESWTTGCSAYEANDVSSGVLNALSFGGWANGESFVLRENDLSFEMRSSVREPCRSRASWIGFWWTTCRSSVTGLPPLVARTTGRLVQKLKPSSPTFLFSSSSPSFFVQTSLSLHTLSHLNLSLSHLSFFHDLGSWQRWYQSIRFRFIWVGCGA